MDNNEQIHSEEDEAYDYNREPPLDSFTTSKNRGRSKYVFTTICFLLALILLNAYNHGSSAGDSSSWLPLVGAIVLAILGVVFLTSSDSPPEYKTAASENMENEESEESAEEIPPSTFEEFVQEALSSIPAEFHEKMENVMVRVVYEPEEEVLERLEVKAGYILFGLYVGIPLTTYGRNNASYPEVITIYQRPIEEYCRHNPTRIREQVRSTVLHEVAHHFGMGHEEMPIWIK